MTAARLVQLHGRPGEGGGEDEEVRDRGVRLAGGLDERGVAGCGNAEADEAEAANGANLSALRDCPEEELSCGRQRPVISDGVTPFVNENYHLNMVFPRGDRVCMTRSGNAAHGFFAVYSPPLGCPARPERGPRFIALGFRPGNRLEPSPCRLRVAFAVRMCLTQTWLPLTSLQGRGIRG